MEIYDWKEKNHSKREFLMTPEDVERIWSALCGKVREQAM